MRIRAVLVLHLVLSSLAWSETLVTENVYLSGHGSDDAQPWDFYCTQGRNSGFWTKIAVPSCWEQQGFGDYDYGVEFRPNERMPQPLRAPAEQGIYRRDFTVPAAWRGRAVRIVFEGVLTDAEVSINGVSAGPVHQGGFYRFSYDITDKLRFDAPNHLEVTVSKHSANPSVNRAERIGDYWNFGGIFRPVRLEAVPAQHLERVAIDARADGAFAADVFLGGDLPAGNEVVVQLKTALGEPVGSPVSVAVPAGAKQVNVRTQLPGVATWSAETPNLYTAEFTLRTGGIVPAAHAMKQRFGFRTFELRPGDGLYLNGHKITLKGVCRHSFWPETGRTLSLVRQQEDIRLMKAANMNAVRMSHYPPDAEFLDLCDEAGLYVLDELAGWQGSYDTPTGRILIPEMLKRDVNHPSILFWDNGNEGGFNRDLDGEYSLYDPQQRRVLHPWDPFGGIDTRHYPPYEDLVRRLKGPNLVMPTDYLHGLYDGGAGAGLEDYWQALSASPVGAGAFIWVFADEGIARTDQNGRIDVFSTYAPDGIVGPRHEKEGSYYAVREIWSPIQIAPPVLNEKFNGALTVTNHYDFTSVAQCRFEWQLLRFPGPFEGATRSKVLARGDIAAPAIAPHETGTLALNLPANWREAEALAFTVIGPDREELWTNTWPVLPSSPQNPFSTASTAPPESPKAVTSAGEIRLSAGTTTAKFDASTGVLQSLQHDGKSFAFANGPHVVFARPENAGPVEWTTLAAGDTTGEIQIRKLAVPKPASTLEIELEFTPAMAFAGFKLEISPDGSAWKTLYDGTRRAGDGKRFNFPPQNVVAVRLSDIRDNRGLPVGVKSIKLGYAPARFPELSLIGGSVSSGTGRDPATGETVAWVETRGTAGLDHFRWTLRMDGSLRLDYDYALEGDFLYHGITFDHAEKDLTSLRWLGAGPYRVWQNRLQGTWLGVHEIAHSDLQPGRAWNYPEFQGMFGQLHWAQLKTPAGLLTVMNSSNDVFLRVGTPRINHQFTTVEFPAGDISFLHAIPAIGSKFILPEKSGPSGLPAKASGHYRGSLTFSLGEPPGEKD